ncbi:MAG TPA: nitroreductase family deazaflavin-dependent oxidoreductase [Marmoricola sp.]|nr:nitroreductase family deazaflavin-dependent oxidoreductase [Marmoricola sp.]
MDKKPKGIDDPGAVKFMKVMAAFNVWLFRRTGGRLGSHWRIGAGFRNPVPICLVEHTGRKTGLTRTTPLVYLADGSDVVVVASQAGRPENPMWFGNVCANPDVTVLLGRDRRPMRARVADEDERARLWPLLVAHYPDYDSYQSWTERVIPVVVLVPR